MKTLTTDPNPILTRATVKTVALEDLADPVQHVRPRRDVKREMLLLWRKETAQVAVAPFNREVEVFGFTKGHFSFLDLLTALLEKTGPAHIDLSTWTAARRDTEALANLRRHATAIDTAAGTSQILSIRWLIDFTFLRRAPEMVATLRQTFGNDALRVAHVHAQFALIYNDAWQVVVRTSMNLNQNPRTEDYHLAHDPDLFAFVRSMMDRVWKLQPRQLADANAGAVRKHFLKELTP